MKQLLNVIVAAACLIGCSTDTTPTMTRHTLDHGGLEREYFVFLPSVYDGERDLPVAIFMHGYGGTATGTEAEVTQGLNFYAEKYGYVMVYPQSTWFMAYPGTDRQWEVTSWNHISDAFDKGPEGPICTSASPPELCPPECGTCGKCGWASCNDDVGFLRKLVAQVNDAFAVNPERFFISGFSNGAMMAQRAGCEASELFAGVALIGGRVEAGFECTPQHPLPLLQINGGADRTVPADGSESDYGNFFASSRSVTDYWTDNASCAAEQEDWRIPAIEGRDISCSVSCGDTEAPSVDCLWPEGNHRWPGTPGFRGSNGYCVTELQSASMPEQLICIAADPGADTWGSDLYFSFFDSLQVAERPRQPALQH